MAMYVKSEYEGFVCTVTVTSDTIDEIDLTSPDFRIDIVDQFHAADSAQHIAGLMEDKESEIKIRDARTDIVVEGTEAHAQYPDAYTYAQVSGFYDAQITDLHYAPTKADVDRINKIVSGLSLTMDDANSAINAKEYGTSGSSGTKGIQDYMSELNIPMLSIANQGSTTYNTSGTSGAYHIVKSDVFANTDDETLIRNGMQYWVSKDKKSMTFRFIPQPNAQYKFQSVVVVVAFDYQNIARFEVCLMPRLITGDLEPYANATNKQGKLDDVPVVSQDNDPFVPVYNRSTSSKTPEGEVVWTEVDPPDRYRPDYQFNDDTDDNHFYANTTPYTTDMKAQPEHAGTEVVPLYVLRSSAFITEDIEESGYTYNWSKFKSEIHDIANLSSMPIPFNINRSTATDSTIEAQNKKITLVSSYTGNDAEIQGLNEVDAKLFEITQFIETSAQVPVFSQNQVRVTVAI